MQFKHSDLISFSLKITVSALLKIIGIRITRYQTKYGSLLGIAHGKI